MSIEPRHNIRAETAFKSAIGSNPATQVTSEELRKAFESPEVQAVIAALRRAMQKLMRPLQKDSPEDRKVFQDLNAALAAAKAKTAAKLTSRHLPVPKDIEDWEELARIVEIRKEPIGELTAREIYNRALEWAEEVRAEAKRRKIAAQLAAEAEAEIAAPPTPQSPGAGEAKEATQSPLPTGFLGGEALADALGIPRERRGAFFQRLWRERLTLGDANWQEVRNPRPNAPRYIYLVDNPRLQTLAKDYREPKSA